MSDIAGAVSWPGQRHWNMESVYDYGARAGFWRLHRLFTDLNIPVTIYGVTKQFPREEMFGLSAQLRRAAVSIASNIVEGSVRTSLSEYVHFPNIAYASAREVEYQVSLAGRLGFLHATSLAELGALCTETSYILNGLLRSLRAL